MNEAPELLRQPRFLQVIIPREGFKKMLGLHLTLKPYITKIASLLLLAEEPDIVSLNFYKSKGDLFYDFSTVSADQKISRKKAMEIQKQIAFQIFFRLLHNEKFSPWKLFFEENEKVTRALTMALIELVSEGKTLELS